MITENVKKRLIHKRMCINYLENSLTYDILFSKDAVYCGLTVWVIGLILNPLVESISSVVLLGWDSLLWARHLWYFCHYISIGTYQWVWWDMSFSFVNYLRGNGAMQECGCSSSRIAVRTVLRFLQVPFSVSLKSKTKMKVELPFLEWGHGRLR